MDTLWHMCTGTDRERKMGEGKREGGKISRSNKIICVCMYIAFIKNRIGKYYKYMDSGMRLVNFEAQFSQ